MNAINLEIMIKKIFLSMVVILSAFVGLHAEDTTDKIYINDFSIAPGETKEVNVCLQSTQLYRGFQVNIYLPEGLSFVSYNPSRPNYVRATSRIPSSEDPTDPLWSLKGDFSNESLLVTGYSLYNLDPIEVGDGAVFTFKVKASEDLAGVVYIDLKNSRMTGHEKPYENVSFHGPDTRCKVASSNVTLAELCQNGIVGQEYTISDDVLVAIACVKDVDNNIYLMCKDEDDEGKSTSIDPSKLDPSNLPSGYEDYMMCHEGGFTGKKWDQSNWISLYFKGLDSEDAKKIQSLVGKRIKSGTITGLYDKEVEVNHTLKMLNTDLEPFDDQLVGYIPNRYCPANFLQENLDKDGASGHGNYSDRHYFFMNPKIQEICEITFAVWNGSYFVLPHPTENGNMNSTDIHGAVWAEWNFNSYDNLDLTKGVAYKFKAIVHKGGLQKKMGAPSPKDEPQTVTPGYYTPDDLNNSDTYVVYPFDFDPTESENIVTTINTPTANGEVKSVKYVNVAGLESDRPFQGVNIVVTEYTDGSRQSTKIIIK